MQPPGPSQPVVTLASKLGTSAHISPLLKRAARLGLRSVADFHTLTVQRGCRHYWQGNEPAGELVSEQDISNEELAIAMLTVAQPYDSHLIRCGAAMLGARGNSPARLAFLAKKERCEQVVRYIAEAGERFEPENPFWTELLSILPVTPPVRDGVLPHPTRFVAMTGYQRGVGKQIRTEWQRPQRLKAA